MVGVLPTLITVYPRSLSFTVEPQEHGGLSLAALGMGHDNFKRGESTGSEEEGNVPGERKGSVNKARPSKPGFFRSRSCSLPTSGIRTPMQQRMTSERRFPKAYRFQS